MSQGSDLENTSIGHIDNLKDLSTDTVKGQNAILVNATESMLGDLRKSYSKYTQSGGASNAFTAAQLSARIENTLDLLPAKERNRLKALYNTDLQKAEKVGREAGVDLDKIIDQKKKEPLKANAKPNVDAMKAAGRRLEKFWADENSNLTDRVKALTREAAIKGESWRTLSLKIRELLTTGEQSAESQRKNKKMGIAQRAELIARTEMAYAFIEGQKDNYRAMGYQFVRWSAAAERTCGYCMSRDGLIYDIDEIDGAIPAHPRCRCSLIPVEADSLKKPKGPNGPDAARELDDTYWSKSRNDKLSQWKQENRGIRDPKTEDILNNMLRNYQQTPTNSQRFFNPNAKAAQPKWMPTGDVIPNMGKAEQNAAKAEANAQKADEIAALEAAKKEAQEAAAAEAKRVAEAAQKEAAEAQAKAAKMKADTAKAEKKAAGAKKKAAEKQLEEANTVIKFLSNQALAGAKLTAAQQTSLKNAQLKRAAAQKALGLTVDTTGAAQKAAATKAKPKSNIEKLLDAPLTKGQANNILLNLGLKKGKTAQETALLKKAKDTIGGTIKSADTVKAEKKAAPKAEKKPLEPTPGKTPKDTTDVKYKYTARDWKKLGYKSEADLRAALSSVRSYTGNSFTAIKREQLRNRPASELSGYEKNLVSETKSKNSQRVKDAIQIEGFIKRAPKYKGEIHRGIKVKTEADAMAAIKHMTKGQGSMESWSNDLEVAQSFGTRRGMVSVIFNVVNKHGAPVAGSSKYAKESEVIVPQDVVYKIKGTKKKVIDHIGEKVIRYEVDLIMV